MVEKFDFKEEFHDTLIKVEKNHIWIYDDISVESSLEVNKKINEIFNEIMSDSFNSLLSKDELSPIWIHLNSPGGDIISAFSIVDTIRFLQKRVRFFTIIEGESSSAASYISIIGDKRFMGKHSLMLIHDLYTAAEGKTKDLEDMKFNNDLISKQIKELYLEHSNLTEELFDDIILNERFLDSIKCKELNLIDEIL